MGNLRVYCFLKGIEAGGHGHGKSPPLSNLLQSIITAIPDGPPIIAAGGVSTGGQVAGLLAIGAAGVALGTGFLYTHECMYTDDMKSVLVECDVNSTIRGHMFDQVNPTPTTVSWPEGVNGRGVVNKIVEDFQEGVSIEERQRRYREGKAKGEKERLIIWAGDGVGIIKEIKSTTVNHDHLCRLYQLSVLTYFVGQAVVHELHADTVKSLRRAALLLQ